MAAAIRQAKQVDVDLVESKGGVFDVELNGQLIYSKHETLRFPTHEEILEQLNA
ncbi:MAG: SelT/SelW/SelH family protein [Fuerstiella sp.]|nr:SelT/SelW/SelH family protein [Fuerstiella sp.]MCP4784167.1 SelT/SelW/SelH family protein [Fuerstiella sp.]MCP4858345.1 SelT/SelW/SelH family protein [Fuerstiella sp.]